MYGKCGCIAKARGIFNKMEHRNLVSWNAMIILFGNNGFRRKAMELLVKMKTTGVKPDFVTFVGLLTACNHAELVDEGRVYFQFHGRNLWGFSSNRGFFSSLIDLLGRAGRLKEADEYMEKFPFGHDPFVSGSFLSSCRLHGDIDAGKC